MSAARPVVTIRPENVEIGDRIRITYPVYMGVQRVNEGTVYRRIDDGDIRELHTREGGLLFAWSPKQRPKFTVELLSRAPVEQATLPGMDDVRLRAV